MSDSYNRGRDGLVRGDDNDEGDYGRGERDREANRTKGVPYKGGDTTKVFEAGKRAGTIWKQNPNKAYWGIIRGVVLAPLVVGAIAAGVALALRQPPQQWAIVAGGITFVLYLLFGTMGMAGAMLAQPTLRGCVTTLIGFVLLGVIAYLFWQSRL